MGKGPSRSIPHIAKGIGETTEVKGATGFFDGSAFNLWVMISGSIPGIECKLGGWSETSEKRGILHGFIQVIDFQSGHVESSETEFCSDGILLGHESVRTWFCSDRVLLGWNSARPLSLFSGRVFGRYSVRTEFCSAVVTLLGQSVRTRFCSDIILFGHGHSAGNSARPLSLCWGRVFRHDSVRPLSLCSGRVFGHDSVRTEFCSTTVTLLGQSVRKGFCSNRILLGRCHSAGAECSDRILFGHCHSARAECSDTIMFGQNSVRPRSLCSGRVFGHDSAWARFCSATVTLFGKSVRTRFCSGKILIGHGHSVPAECSDTILLGKESVFATDTLFRQSVWTRFCSGRILFGYYLGSLHKTCPKLQRLFLCPKRVVHLPGLQEPTNYGTKFETEEQVKSGYRLHLHPFALRFFEHYRMAPGQLVPNGWRKLAGLIYLVQTSGYKLDVTDFMRVFFEICFVKGVANCPGWYNIHSRQRLLKGGQKSNKGWHSRYFFVGLLDKGELPFDRDWNPFCKDFENPSKPTPNNLTKHILSHIKLRGGLCIDEPLSEEQLEWAKIIPPKPIPAGLLIPSPPPAIPSMSSAETVPVVFIPVLISTLIAEMASGSGKSPKGGFLGVLQKAKGKRKEKQPSAELPLFLSGLELLLQNVLHVSEQHLLHGILPRDKEVFQTQTHETFACSFAQAVYTMYASGSEMFSRFEMARQVAADEAQQKREDVKEAQEASHRAEELSKQEADHLAQIATLEKRLERVKRKAAEEVTKARNQGIRDFLDGKAGDEWLKKRADDGLEIYELGFAKAKEMFAERFLDILLDDFVLPAVISLSGETVLPSEAGDAAASHPPGEGPSSDAPEP
ncbi:hypothetical protein RJ639_016081 [Escallonia herrerae]|uniref:Transposase (putative) gypsy type domain-containing protein n=1 Tax=Escallonia herrerae TaxID=1293975 RepID=A0AA89AL72_9ASTE|nr:hypothetical protein RJ639_016081 [Escallonia herrerae]